MGEVVGHPGQLNQTVLGLGGIIQRRLDPPGPSIFLDRPEGYLLSDFQVTGLGWVVAPSLYIKVGWTGWVA